MNERVKVMLRGGLGNQLFQYATGLKLAMENGAELILDTSLLPNEPKVGASVSSWPEQISSFNHGAKIYSSSFVRDHAEIYSRIYQAQRAFGDKFPGVLAKFGLYSNESTQHSNFLNTKPIRKINSYCNDYKFFNSIRPELKLRISDLRAPSKEYLKSLSNAQSEKPISIHLRLGDYKNLHSVYGSVDPNYYARAVMHLSKNEDEREIWIYSDNPVEALEILGPKIPSARIAPNVETLSPLETLLLMTKSSGLVCSNSTFSWWAGYLMEDEESNIIFPRPYFNYGGPPESKDFLPNSWLQLGREFT